MVGDSQPPAVHALAHAINAAIGAPVSYVPTPEIVPTEQSAAFTELVADINAGHVQMLVIVGESNPVLTRAGRPEVRGGDSQGQPRRPLRPVLRRDGDAQPLAHSRGPLSRGLERRAHDRRHRVDRPAADPAALRRQVGARSDRDDVGSTGARRLRRRSGTGTGRRTVRAAGPAPQPSPRTPHRAFEKPGASGCTTASSKARRRSRERRPLRLMWRRASGRRRRRSTASR